MRWSDTWKLTTWKAVIIQKKNNSGSTQIVSRGKETRRDDWHRKTFRMRLKETWDCRGEKNKSYGARRPVHWRDRWIWEIETYDFVYFNLTVTFFIKGKKTDYEPFLDQTSWNERDNLPYSYQVLKQCWKNGYAAPTISSIRKKCDPLGEGML